MNLEEDEEGDVEIKGVKYSEMPLQIIDTGYGLERFAGLLRAPYYLRSDLPRKRCLAKAASRIFSKMFDMTQDE